MATVDTTGQTPNQTAQTGMSVAELNKKLTEAKSSRSRFEPEWYLNLAFFFGRQWAYWNRGKLDIPSVPAWYRMPVDNRMMPILTSRAARKVKNRPAFVVTPQTADQDDIDAAKIGEKVLEVDWVNYNLSDVLFNTELNCEIMGAAFWKIYWDSTAGDTQDFLYDAEGAPAMLGDRPVKRDMAEQAYGNEPMPEGYNFRPIAKGDVCVELLSPLEIYPDPLATTMDDCEWLIEEKVRSVEYVRKRWPQLGNLKPDADAPVGPVESRMAGPNRTTGETDANAKGLRVREMWMRPTTKYPRGCRHVWVRDKIAEADDSPTDPMPYVMFSGIRTGKHRFWPMAMATPLRPPQIELNKINAQVAQNAARFGNPSLLASREANVAYEGKPGERVDYSSTVPDPVPQFLVPPSVPQYVLEQIDRSVAAMTEISGLHEVSNAQVPTGVTAASAINLLQEADDTRIGPEIEDMEGRIGEAGTKILTLRAKFNTDERLIKIAGEDGNWDITSFRNEALRGNTKAEVQAGSAMPRSKAAKQAAMLEILTLAFQYGLTFDPRDLRRFFKDYEVAALDRLFGGLSADESQANNENRQMSQGLAVDIHEWDDHAMHVVIHNDFRKSSRFERLDPAIQRIIGLHIQSHQEFMVQQTNSQMAAQSQEGQQQAQASMVQHLTPQGGLQNPQGSPTTSGGG